MSNSFTAKRLKTQCSRLFPLSPVPRVAVKRSPQISLFCCPCTCRRTYSGSNPRSDSHDGNRLVEVHRHESAGLVRIHYVNRKQQDASGKEGQTTKSHVRQTSTNNELGLHALQPARQDDPGKEGQTTNLCISRIDPKDPPGFHMLQRFRQDASGKTPKTNTDEYVAFDPSQ